jgi:nascent polypeptide-associated complex subunit alpha
MDEIMPKLPKSMQNRQRNIKQLRSQGSAPAAGGEGKVNRKMRRQMAQQGIEGMEEIPATKVIIKTEEGNIVVNSPQVIKLNQGGMEVYQVIGKGEKAEGGAEEGEEGEEIEDGAEFDADAEFSTADGGALNVQITEQDIQLVMMQTSVSHEQAEAALRDANGDLARAIIALKSR